VLTESHNR